MGDNGFDDDTDYISSFTTDKYYVSEYPEGETEFSGFVLNVGSVNHKSKKQKRIESVINTLEYLLDPEEVDNMIYTRECLKRCIKSLKKCIKN